jgi:hypothetical protein
MADRDQSPTHGQEVPGEPHDPATPGNRPATGARVVDHATTFSGGFGGGAEATDFLGLSQELTGMDAGPMHTGHTGHTGPTGIPGGRTHPGEYPTTPESSPSWLLQQEHIVGEDGEHAEGDEHEAPEEETSKFRPRKRSASVWTKIAAVLLVGAGATFGYRMWASTQSESTEPSEPIAHAPKAHTQPGGTGETVKPTPPDGTWTEPEFRSLTDSGTGTPDATTAGTTATDSTASATTPRIGQERLDSWMQQHGMGANAANAENSAPVSGPFITMLLGLGANSSPTAMPPAGSMTTDAAGSTELAADPHASTETLRKGAHAEATPAKSPVGGLRLATPEELAGIWPGDTVPMDALDAESRLLTPGVGQVHVIMKTGEIFDGRLYAIGTGQVWLESAIGRLALEGKRVDTIALVTMEEVNGKTVEDLPRMRVRTPGGLFFGKVISREDDRVTLLTEDGGKITLVSRDVEPAPLGDTRVIGRVEKKP